MMRKKRLLALLLTAGMITGILPSAALAAEGETTSADPALVEVFEEKEEETAPSEKETDREDPAEEAEEELLEEEEAVLFSDEASDPEEGIAPLAEGDNMDFVHPTDGASVTVEAPEGSDGSGYTPDKMLGTNLGLEEGGTRAPRYISPNTKDGTHVVVINLGQQRQVSTVKIYWFNNNFTGLTIHVSPSASGDGDWTEVFTRSERIRSATQQISFTEQTVQRIKLTISGCDDQGFHTDMAGAYDIGIYNVQAYKTPPTIETEETGATPEGNLAQIGTFRSQAKPSVGTAAVDSMATIRASASGWPSGDDATHAANRVGNAFDGDISTAWTAPIGAANPWVVVNLGKIRTIKGVRLNFGRTNIKNYIIEGTTDPQGQWEVLFEKNDDQFITQTTLAHNLASTKPARFIRLTVTDYDQTGSVVLKEMGIYKDEVVVEQLPDTPEGNLCRPTDGATVTPTVVDEETDTSFVAANLTDGSLSTRWSSNANVSNPWVQIDLGKLRAVSSVVSYWCGDSSQTVVNGYTISVSKTGAEGSWTTVKTVNTTVACNKAAPGAHPIYDNFEATAARYIKIQATGYRSNAIENETVPWKSMSLWEVQAYRDEQQPPVTAADMVSWLRPSYAQGADKMTYTVAGGKQIPDTHEVVFAANLEQIVGPDGTIYQPLVDMPVEVALTVSAKDGSDWATSPNSAVQTFTIPGKYTSDGSNPKPGVIPEIMEWYTTAAQNGKKYTLTADSRIVAGAELSGVANELKADIRDLFGYDLSVVSSGAAAGDIELILGSGDRVAGFDQETYLMEISDKVTITATHSTGAYWGTRSILQALKLGQGSALQGTARDYPEFRVRGFVLDVGRKPQSMEHLYNIAKNMAWYKLNDFHVHLNDNLIFMEDYGITADNYTNQADYDKANAAYSAFRLESDITEEAGGIPLTARDYAYTKTGFKQFISDSAAIGINVVPEFDAPAHAKAIVDAFPSLRLQRVWGGQWGYNHPANCHMDLTNNYDASVGKIQEIFDEYLEGSDPVFSGEVVHFGADEYFGGGTAYRRFMKDMIQYLKEKDKTPRVWGSLSHSMISSGEPTLQFDSKADNKGVQINIWNTGWANPNSMYNLGFDLINVTDGPAYMVPNGGGGRGTYGDYLDLTAIYGWEPNVIGGARFPAGSSQILGSAYAIWNDNIDTRASGLDEVDIFHRFFDTLPVIAVQQWGDGGQLDRTLAQLQEDVKITGYAPQTDPFHEGGRKEGTKQYFKYDFAQEADLSGNGHDLTLTNARLEEGALVLNGGESYAGTGLDKLGWGNKLTFRAKKTSGGGEEQILFESDHAYGEYAIKALPVAGKTDKWKLGFSRELYDYAFDVELPVGEWVELTITNDRQSTKLSVDGAAAVAAVGQFVAKPDSNTQFQGKTGITNSSLQLPVARIGGKQNAFEGLVDDVSVSGTADKSPVDDGAYDVPVSKYTVSAGSHQPDQEPEKAVDGDAGTTWHTKWRETCTERWFQITLDREETVSGLRYLRGSGANGVIATYDIQVSDDGSVWRTVKNDGSFTADTVWQSGTFDAVTTRYIRLLAKETRGDPANDFICAAEIRVCYAPDLGAEGKGAVTFPEESYPLVEGAARPEPIVTFEGLLLEKDVDYVLSYENNTAAGTGTVKITGKGIYTGTLSASFTITGGEAPVEKKDLSEAGKTTVTLPQSSYTATGSAITPEPVVKYEDVTLRKGTDYTVAYADNTAVGTASVTVTGMGDYTGSVTVTFAITEASGGNTGGGTGGNTGGSTGGSGSTGGGGGSGGGLGTGVGTTVPAGPTITTSTDRQAGTVTSTAKYPNGTTVKSVTAGETVTATVTIPTSVKEPSKVLIPTTAKPTVGQVAVILHPDGSREIVKNSLPDEKGLEVVLSGSARLQIIDNSKQFSDVEEENWAQEAVTFVTSREIFNGTGSGTFTPDGEMSRAMVCTVLANLEGVNTAGGSTWYEKAVEWAREKGVSDGANPNATVTREQLAVMLYRYMGSPEIETVMPEEMSFADTDQISDWAVRAMIWAVEKGILKGRDGIYLAPQATASRAEVAVMMQRYIALM